MKRNRQVYEMTLTAIIGAIILLLSLVPQIGFIRILPGVSVTIVHIPVIIGIFFLSFRYSLALGFFFGLGSFLAALIYASTPFDLAFINPLISILPRVLFAGAASLIATGFKKLSFLKQGKLIMFGIVSVVTAVGLFFGVNQLTKQVTYRKHTENSGLIYQAYEEEAEQTVIDDLEALNIILLADAEDSFANARKFTIPISIVLIVGIITLYYFTTVRKKHVYTYIPSIFILATLAHTVLVLGSVILFNPKVFYETFGDSQSILLIIYTIAAANGIIEAFIAALVGTPVASAVMLRLEED